MRIISQRFLTEEEYSVLKTKSEIDPEKYAQLLSRSDGNKKEINKIINNLSGSRIDNSFTNSQVSNKKLYDITFIFPDRKKFKPVINIHRASTIEDNNFQNKRKDKIYIKIWFKTKQNQAAFSAIIGLNDKQAEHLKNNKELLTGNYFVDELDMTKQYFNDNYNSLRRQNIIDTSNKYAKKLLEKEIKILQIRTN